MNAWGVEILCPHWFSSCPGITDPLPTNCRALSSNKYRYVNHNTYHTYLLVLEFFQYPHVLPHTRCFAGGPLQQVEEAKAVGELAILEPGFGLSQGREPLQNLSCFHCQNAFIGGFNSFETFWYTGTHIISHRCRSKFDCWGEPLFPSVHVWGKTIERCRIVNASIWASDYQHCKGLKAERVWLIHSKTNWSTLCNHKHVFHQGQQ